MPVAASPSQPRAEPAGTPPPPAAARAAAAAAPALLLAALLAAAGCAGGAPRQGAEAAGWDGRRGYDGAGDYGYDPEASRAEASAYRAGAAARAYPPPPGPPEDPWGPYIREAAARFRVPERWIREVMRQESGGRPRDGGGLPITSPAGAMGLMQVMPRTWDLLRARHGLGPDPHEPRDNILAGAAYIRAMHERYGAPGFLAAYNAGPERVDLFLAGAKILPDETVGYLASVAPRLGSEVPMSGPLVAYAEGGGGGDASGHRTAHAAAADLAYAGGGMTGVEYHGAAPVAEDPSLRAFDGGGLVTPDAPTGGRCRAPHKLTHRWARDPRNS